MSAASPNFWSATAPYGAAVVAAAAVLAAAWISHLGKVSEFRQNWINDLRRDIADYTGAAEKWFRKWEEINPLESETKAVREREELFPLTNAARVIFLADQAATKPTSKSI